MSDDSESSDKKNDEQIAARVSDDDTLVDGYKSTNIVGGGDKTDCVDNMSGPQGTRVLHGDVSDRVSIGSEKARVDHGKVRVSEIDGHGGSKLKEKVDLELIPRAIDSKIDARNENRDVRNGKFGHSGGLKAGNGHVVESGKKHTASQYDNMLSMFDEFAGNARRGSVSRSIGYGYEVGDMVWGKVKSHPWWPGHIYNEALATSSVRRTKREGHVLVAFFGDNSYGWFDPAELIPFNSNFAEKWKQTNSRTFVKAVDEAVYEASRRSGMGVACRCRNPYNFRPASVEGYSAVDVDDYEPGAVYSESQIKKVRENFQPGEMVDFLKQLSLTAMNESGSIEFLSNKATVLAYRRASYEEFDETYAQAFGAQPIRPSRQPVEAVVQPSRAPLSGRMVIAEDLGKKNSSSKYSKDKDRAKKDKYLFKRRDESNDLRTQQTNLGQTSSSIPPVYVEGSTAFAAGEYMLEKTTPAVPVNPEILAKHEHMGTVSKTGYASLSRGVTAKEDKKPAVVKFSMPGPQMNADKVEFSPSPQVSQASSGHNSHLIEETPTAVGKGKAYVLDLKDGSGSDVAMAPASEEGYGKRVYPNVADEMPRTSEASAVEGFQLPPRLPAGVEEWHGREQVQDGHRGGAQVLASTDAKLDGGEGFGMRIDSSGKKAQQAHRRPVVELSTENSVLVEKKKKRKKEMGMERSFDRGQMRAASGKGGALEGSVAGRTAVQVPMSSREDFQVDRQKKDSGASTLLPPDCTQMHQMGGIETIEMNLPQLLSYLQDLALNPFHGVGTRSPAIIRQVFLRFRSLVYQKSLAVTDSESNEARASKSPGTTVATDNAPVENVKDLPSLKPVKPPVRPEDPTKAGRKRGPSDRQDEMAAKKKKKINDLKLLAAEKKAAQKTPESQRGDAKETVVVPTSGKAVKFESSRKTVPLTRAAAPDPTMLVMKFPPRGMLPSLSELKARFARFGPLDHMGTRVFWKSSSCRVVYRHKVDAQAAYKFASECNNLFGNTNVRCYIREFGDPAPESESGKVQRDDATSFGTPQLRESGGEQQRPASSQTLQQPVQLKSCLKKSSGDEGIVVVGGGNNGGGGGRGARVKFMLGGEDSSSSSRGEQMIGNNYYYYNNASFADGGGASSSSFSSSSSSSCSSSLAMDINSENIQKVIPPSPSPNLPLPSVQIPVPPNHLQYTEVAPRNAHNFNTIFAPPAPSTSNVDIAQQMLSLLTKCKDVVANLTGTLGYVPYRPL